MFTRISLSGCGWKVFWYYGVIQKLAEHNMIDLNKVDFITASAGGGAAIHFLSSLDGYQGFKKALSVANQVKLHKKTKMVDIATKSMYKDSPDDIHETGRLTICYTQISLLPFNMKYQMQSYFENKNDLFEALRMSCSIPMINDYFRFQNKLLRLDAGFLCNQPSNHHNTLRISASPLSFGSDIRPSPSELFNYMIDIPNDDIAEKMFNVGLQDGENFCIKYKQHHT